MISPKYLRYLNRLKYTYLILMVLAALTICASRSGLDYAGMISFGFFIVLFSGLLFLTGKAKLSLSITSTIIIIIQLLNQIKIHYYKERLFFTDITFAIDPNNFEVLNHYPGALAAFVALIIIFIINILLFFKSAKLKLPFRALSLVATLLVTGGIYFSLKNPDNIKNWQMALPKGRGTIVNLFVSSQNMNYSPPYYEESEHYFLEKASTLQKKEVLPSKPDIVVMLQESTTDPDFYDFKNHTLPKLQMFSPTDQYTKANSLLRVQTFGGGTWQSEFSLLTGLDTDDFEFRKKSVFYTVASHINTSLFKELKNNGYYTVILTTFADGSYHSGATYRDFGIDQIIRPQELGYPAPNGQNIWAISSEELLTYAKQILEKHTDKPLFIYLLSIAEHGPYDEKHQDNLGIKNKVPLKSTVGQFNDYYARQQKLSDATVKFSNDIMARTTPTLFLYFGDHQGSVDWKDGYKTSLPNPDYLTQFYMKDNFDPDKVDNLGEVTDISFLGGMILERLGQQTTPHYTANIQMRHLCQGKLSDCSDKKLVNSYKRYLYQNLKSAGQ